MTGLAGCAEIAVAGKFVSNRKRSRWLLSHHAGAQREPDLIILDLGLPAGDGFVVLDRLHRNPELAAIPVIVLTARDPESTERKALQMGACAFFQKPADNGALLGVIRARLAQASGNPNLAS